MLNLGARITLFVGSYTPLALIFVVLYVGKQNVVAAIAGVCFVIGLLGPRVLLWLVATDTEPLTDKVVEGHTRGDEVMGYVAGYLIPFLALNLADWRQMLCLIIFVGILGYLYVTTDMLYINPILSLMGYKVYDVTLEKNGRYRIISHGRLRCGDSVLLAKVSSDVWLRKDRS